MFFQGTLQEGITAALEQSKSVVCFVTDSGDDSQIWEEDFLPTSEASSLFESQAILLRLEAGSQEEGFLTQLYPIPKKPTLIIIKNGELKEYIVAGVTKDEFVRRVKVVLQPTVLPTAMPTQSEQASAPSPTSQSTSTSGNTSTNSGSGQGVSSSAQSHTQQVLAEQPAPVADTHLSTDSNNAEDDTKHHHADETKVRDSTKSTESSSKEAQAKQHAEQLKKKQNEAREERRRILKAIEDDKIARQARKAELEAERQAPTSTPTYSAPGSQPRPSNSRLSEHCAIQVRLLDGSTIRNRFSSTTDTVRSIRKWVDDARTDGKTPYTFKILLTPLPSKAILTDEESQSLQTLKLAPSATLILVPLAGKKTTRPTTSYSAASKSLPTMVTDNGPNAGQENQGGDGNDNNIFLRFITFILGIINGIFGVIMSFLTTLFSTAGAPQLVDQARQQRQQQQQQASSSATTGGAGDGSRINTLKRQKRPENRNDQQFYNGNSTNFEPRPDDKDE